MPRLTPLRRAVVSFPFVLLLVAGAAQAAVVRTFTFSTSSLAIFALLVLVSAAALTWPLSVRSSAS